MYFWHNILVCKARDLHRRIRLASLCRFGGLLARFEVWGPRKPKMTQTGRWLAAGRALAGPWPDHPVNPSLLDVPSRGEGASLHTDTNPFMLAHIREYCVLNCSLGLSSALCPAPDHFSRILAHRFLSARARYEAHISCECDCYCLLVHCGRHRNGSEKKASDTSDFYLS